MEENDEKKSSGCGLLVLYNTMFRRQPPPAAAAVSPRRSSSSTAAASTLTPSNSKRRSRSSGSDEASLLSSAINVASDADANGLPPQINSYYYSNAKPRTPNQYQFRPNTKPKAAVGVGGPLPAGPTGLARNTSISTELDIMIHDHQRSKGSSTLVRASSGNVMLYGNLGNLRGPGAVTPNRNGLDYLPKTAPESSASNAVAVAGTNGFTTNANARNESQDNEPPEEEAPTVICRALSRRLDPEELKEMGNEEYNKGKFAEAVALYDRAILMNPDKASYFSNKAAALTGLGKLLEAVEECREAVRLDPSYYRAHHRLATLYLRLGEAEKALHHYKLSRTEANCSEISRVKEFQAHLYKCHEARRLKDWNTVLKETQSAISTGADSAPQVSANKAEALLMLWRHEEADTALSSLSKFDVDAATKFFGAIRNAFFLAVRAQVDLAAGRFEDAVSVAHRAARLDPSSKEVSSTARKARAVASARARGNDLFKTSRFEEACAAYGEGLEHDHHNAILLCNRAACRSKLGQWERAIEDCNAALSMRPSYSKARLRRADCNAKLERWEASVQDYEALLSEMPGDEDMRKSLLEAQAQLRKQQGGGSICTRHGSDLLHITTKDQFRQIIMSSRLSIALFFNPTGKVSEQIMPLLEQLCKKYPSVTFLKVDMEENPYVARSEGPRSVPIFRIYKDGSSIKEIAGSDCEQVESSIRSFIA